MVLKSFDKREPEATPGETPAGGSWLFRLFMAWFSRGGRQARRDPWRTP